MMHKKVKVLAKGHTTNKQEKWHLNPSYFNHHTKLSSSKPLKSDILKQAGA